MEYIKGKNIISKLMKSALSIGIFIALISSNTLYSYLCY